MISGARRISAAVFALLVASSGLSAGAPPNEGAEANAKEEASVPATLPETEKKPAPNVKSEEASPQLSKAAEEKLRTERLDLFLKGELDPRVNLDEVLTWPLDSNLAVEYLKDAAARDEADTSVAARFARLSSSERAALIAAHQQRALDLQMRDKELARLKKDIESLAAQTKNLKEYLAGKLDLNIKPASVLQITAYRPPPAPSALPEDTTLVADFERGLGELRTLQQTFVQLAGEERAALSAAHDKRLADAAEALRIAADTGLTAKAEAAVAAEEKQKALDEALQAKSEMARLIAEERARLFGVEESQALFESQLKEQVAREAQRHEKALVLARRAREFVSASRPTDEREVEASTVYEELVAHLTELRAALRWVLRTVGENPEIAGPGRDESLPKLQHDDRLAAMSARLMKERKRLEDDSVAVSIAKAKSLRDDMVAGNELRLEVLEHLSPEDRNELKSFRRLGVAQVKRELEQIALESRYHLFRTKNALGSSLGALEPLLLFFALGKLLALTVGFRWWRTRAPQLFEELATWGRSPDAGPAGPLAISAAWYGDRVRAPIEWYVYATICLNILGDVASLPETAYLTELIMWLCVGGFSARWIDTAFARQNAREDHLAALRYRSLRLLQFSAIAVVLLLRLAVISVGHGAIYSWIGTASLILIAPVALALLVWWRPEVKRQASNHPDPSKLIKWAAATEVGPASLAATAIAGTQLAAETLYRFALRRVSHLPTTQRLLAYVFRRELEKRATTNSDDYEDLPPPSSRICRTSQPRTSWSPPTESRSLKSSPISSPATQTPSWRWSANAA